MIQQMWEQSKWPIRNGIYFGDERVVPLDISVDWKTTYPTISILRLPLTTLSEIKECQEDRKTTLIELGGSSYTDSNLCIHVGEGSWGSEGFVAVTQISDGKLVWLAYFEYSNPFDEVEIVDGNVLATSNHGHV